MRSKESSSRANLRRFMMFQLISWAVSSVLMLIVFWVSSHAPARLALSRLNFWSLWVAMIYGLFILAQGSNHYRAVNLFKISTFIAPVWFSIQAIEYCKLGHFSEIFILLTLLVLPVFGIIIATDLGVRRWPLYLAIFFQLVVTLLTIFWGLVTFF